MQILQTCVAFRWLSFKTNFSTQYNICKNGNLVDKWSDYCTITSIESKICIHSSFSGKAAQPTFQTRNEIHCHFGEIVRWLVRQLGFVDVSLFDGGCKIKVKV